jgi:hypothetical protein
MKNELHLSINTPCSEKFEAFTPTKNGGFCASCSKEVVDFTRMTDQEIVDYFDTSDESTCGRFRNTQLKSYWITQHQRNYIGLGIAGLSLVSLLASASVEAQEKKPPVMEVWSSQQKEDVKLLNFTKDGAIVEGVVVDQDGALPGVSVLIKETFKGTDTNIDGKFKFSKPLKSGTTLIFSYLGYETVKIKIGLWTKTPMRIVMKESDEITLGMVIMGEVQTERLFKSKKSHFKKKKKKG